MADVRGAMVRLWEELRGRPPVTPPPLVALVGPDQDAEDVAQPDPGDSGPPAWPLQSISGQVMLIVYRDSRGAESTRQVVCRRIDGYAAAAQLYAWCELRGRQRTFRIDRIVRATDVVTGEVFEPGHSLLDAYLLDRESTGRYRFGLPPRKFADFNAALNIMAFVARCDGNWHRLEVAAIEEFVMACWLRFDFPGDLDLVAVADHIARLAPDDETLWQSVMRCAENPKLADLVVRHIGNVIDADGMHHPSEVYWATEIAAALKS